MTRDVELNFSFTTDDKIKIDVRIGCIPQEHEVDWVVLTETETEKAYEIQAETLTPADQARLYREIELEMCNYLAGYEDRCAE